MRQATIRILLAVSVLSLAPAGRAPAADDALSPAQIALFESNHLKDINRPVQLAYSFEHLGAPKGNYTDQVTADVAVEPDGGKKDVTVAFLTGDHKMNFPPAVGFNGNPLLMYFLEHDVVEMKEVTGGASTYFRNRIRRAFAEAAEMHPVEITLQGEKRAATEIVVTPFLNDPNIDRFPGFSGKSYHFVLSDAVPGTIYQIKTAVPGLSDAPNTFAESMTFEGEHDKAQ